MSLIPRIPSVILRFQVQTFTGMKEGAAIQYFFEAQIKVTKLKRKLLWEIHTKKIISVNV